MPEDVRYLWHVLAVRVGQKKLKFSVEGNGTGSIKSPYEDLT